MAQGNALKPASGIYGVPDRLSGQADRWSVQFYWIFVLCLVLVSLPIKNLAYLVPPLFLILLFATGNRSAVRVALLTLGCLVISSISLMVDHVLGSQEVNAAGMFLAVLTVFPLFIFLGTKLPKAIDERVFSRLIHLVAWFVIVQSLIGYFQFAVSRNADAVAGTFGLFDFYYNTISIIQVYYTFNLFCMILFLLQKPHLLLVKIAIVLALLACVLAQSGHQTIFFLASYMLFSVIQLRRIGTAIGAGVIVALVVFSVMQFYPKTWEHTYAWFDKVVYNTQSPKRMVVLDGVEILKSPKNVLMGTGMGQYSSRAALITSNEYLGRELPAIATGKSDYYANAITPAFNQFKSTGEGSAISKPYFSLLSVVVEFGPILAIVFFLVFLKQLRRNFVWMQSPSGQVARIGLICCVGLLFALLCCTIENYLEFPQAIIIPLLLYFLVQARAENIALQEKSVS